MKPGAAQLAIVIPAYKTKYLRATLESIAAQTNQQFSLYVCDDASAEPVEELVREFGARISLQYHRFDENLGGKNLVAQWTRCLALTVEPWLWLFADDDWMEPGCVAAFYGELEKSAGQHDAYRFNTVLEKTASRFMDGGSERRPAHPELETGREFLESQLRGPHNCHMQEIIFSRAAWERACIPDFPLAWFSDDAFITTLGERHSLRTIEGPRIHWRWSDDNISGGHSRQQVRVKLDATRRFVRWAYQFLTAQGMDAMSAARTTEDWYYHRLLQQELFLDGEIIRETRTLAADLWGRHSWTVTCHTVAVNGRILTKKILRRLRHFVVRS